MRVPAETDGVSARESPEPASNGASPITEPDAVAVTVESENDSPDVEIELVFGITRAVGTSAEIAMEQLRNSLSNYGYAVETVKISDLLKDSLQSADKWPPTLDESERIHLLIEEGNRLNREAQREDELAILAVVEIQDLRRRYAKHVGDDGHPNDGPAQPASGEDSSDFSTSSDDESTAVTVRGPSSKAVAEESDVRSVQAASTSPQGKNADHDMQRTTARRAYIIDSLKRPAEIALLRSIYGDHFILVGLQASAEVRANTLISKLATQGRRDRASELAQDLIARDNHEEVKVEVLASGRRVKYGQDMLVTLPMSDVFINVDLPGEAIRQVRRSVQLLFGDPEASGPDLTELGLSLATQTAARSTELGLRVGAVIMNTQGDVLAVGTNHHPTETTSPDFDAGALDIRQLVRTTVSALAEADILVDDAKVKFDKDPEDYVRGLLSTELAESDLKGLTEYQRAVHAEMDALISAARQRADLAEACIYVTNYPCHGCAKHLIALGIRVVYLEPYAKGKAESMYGDATLSFIPFTGVAPRRFDAWFVEGRSADRKDKSGIKIQWQEQQKREAVPNVTPQISMATKHLREKYAIGG